MAAVTIKNELRPHICDICGHSFKLRKQLNQHVRTHSDKRPYICQFCAQTYKAQSALDAHILAKHFEKLPQTNIISYFKCKLCDTRFISKSKLSQHQTANIKDDGSDITCDLCALKFQSTCAYNKHAYTHKGVKESIIMFSCSICKLKFQQKHECEEHFKTHGVAKVEKPARFPCAYCDKVFTYSPYANTHMKMKHRDKFLETFTPGLTPESRKKSFKSLYCKECDKVFKTLTRFREHEAIHTGNFQNLCEFCGKMFAKRSNLRQHLFIHSDDRPHKCSYCARGFSNPEDLTRHERSHTGEKPYKCGVCEQAFSQIGAFKNHERKQNCIRKENTKSVSPDRIPYPALPYGFPYPVY